MIKVVTIDAKHSDMYFARFEKDSGESLEHDGYGLYMKGLGGGDYLRFTIDNATGKIIGWVPLTDEDVEGFLED